MFTHSCSLDSVQDGFTALLVAAQEGHCGMVRMLLEAKADVNMKDNVSESCSSDGVCALAESSTNRGVTKILCCGAIKFELIDAFWTTFFI